MIHEGDECLRCEDTIITGTRERFRVKAVDRTDSTLSTRHGRLCVVCWDRFIRFLDGERVGEGDDSRAVSDS